MQVFPGSGSAINAAKLRAIMLPQSDAVAESEADSIHPVPSMDLKENGTVPSANQQGVETATSTQ